MARSAQTLGELIGRVRGNSQRGPDSAQFLLRIGVGSALLQHIHKHST